MTRGGIVAAMARRSASGSSHWCRLRMPGLGGCGAGLGVGGTSRIGYLLFRGGSDRRCGQVRPDEPVVVGAEFGAGDGTGGGAFDGDGGFFGHGPSATSPTGHVGRMRANGFSQRAGGAMTTSREEVSEVHGSDISVTQCCKQVRNANMHS